MLVPFGFYETFGFFDGGSKRPPYEMHQFTLPYHVGEGLCALPKESAQNKWEGTETLPYKIPLFYMCFYCFIWEYIDTNPAKWAEDKYYTD